MSKMAIRAADNFRAQSRRGGRTALRGIGARAASRLTPRITVRLLAAKHYFVGEPELRWIARIADPQKQSVDVGGHHGVFTYVLARHTKWVHCYEPYPKDAEFLAGAFASRNVTVYPFALSDREGRGDLHVPLGPCGETGGQPSLLPPRIESQAQTHVTVPTKRLDQMGHSNIGFIKIDVEGHECSVVTGAMALIEEQRPALLIELHGYTESDPLTLLEKIQTPGYTGWFFHSGQWMDVHRFRLGQHAELEDAGVRGRCYRKNFLFCPPSYRSEIVDVDRHGGPASKWRS